MKPIDLVNKQAEDEGLWFNAQTAPKAYLQQALRKLHHIIETYENERTKDKSNKNDSPNDNNESTGA